jgi:CBS domain-containing protein
MRGKLLPIRTRRLPIVFRALDVEGKTKPLPVLLCPAHGALMTVGNCGRCARFRRVEFTEQGAPVVACAADRDRPARSVVARDDAQVQSLVRVPSLCVAQDTPIAEILPFVGPHSSADAIPVLDEDARPIGLVSRADLRCMIASGVALSTAVSTALRTLPIRVLPETSLGEALALQTCSVRRDCVVVGADGTFLGLLPASELSD